MEEMKKKGNVIALLPIGVFLVLYLGLGILFEYVMKIPMGFYNVPIVVAFLSAVRANSGASRRQKTAATAKKPNSKEILSPAIFTLIILHTV